MLEDVAICISALDWWSLYTSFIPENLRPEAPLSQFDFGDILILAAENDPMKAIAAMREADQEIQSMGFKEFQATVDTCNSRFEYLAR